MKAIDFFIGFFLMNAMPHFVLGVWKGRMFSAFGFGNKQNIAYGFVCFAISVTLFIYEYGIAGFCRNGIFAGALLILVIYFVTGHFWKNLFRIKK